MNMQNLMAQAQKMQRDVEKKKKEIEETKYTGKSEWVEVILNGKKKMESFKLLIDKLDGDDDKEMLEDMVIIAVNDAISKIDKDLKEKLGSFGDSLNGLF